MKDLFSGLLLCVGLYPVASAVDTPNDRVGPRASVTDLTMHHQGTLDTINAGQSQTISITLYCCFEDPGSNPCTSLTVSVTLASGVPHRDNVEAIATAIRDSIRYNGFCDIDADEDVEVNGGTVSIYGTNPDADPCDDDPVNHCKHPPSGKPNQTDPYVEHRTYDYA